jgi:hypothetical protein
MLCLPISTYLLVGIFVWLDYVVKRTLQKSGFFRGRAIAWLVAWSCAHKKGMAEAIPGKRRGDILR